MTASARNRRGSRPPVPIERISPPDADTFREKYVRTSRPVVLRELARDWVATREWTPETLRRRFGDRLVQVAAIAGRRGVNDPRMGVAYRAIRLSEYIDRLVSPAEPEFSLAMPVETHIPELLDDLPRLNYCSRARWFRHRLWLTPDGVASPLHRDPPENLYVQIVGRKRFVLYSRDATRCMYSHSLWSRTPNYSAVDPERPDPDRFPRFAAAVGYEAELLPGDVLYLPSFWWHYGRAEGTSLSVNIWWADLRPLLLMILAAQAYLKLRQFKL